MNRPYVCTECGVEGVKLWREYQTFADYTRLLCASCALADQKETGPVDDAGYRPHGQRIGRTDQIGWFVPAVLDEEGTSFWGYTSVPQDRITWWRGLPTYPPARSPS